ncbi:bifunctional [glutamate--ammonia ligase]-adenylyl-L-tyrosine phosphorylase/[glutamate--ammonia-ligase] adenylyltransferase [Colwellia sp. MEBiC06753]
MTNCEYRPLPAELSTLAEGRLKQLQANYPQQLARLSDAQLTTLSQALALSDFVFRAIELSPEPVLAMFAEIDFSNTDVIDYQKRIKQALASCTTEEQLHQQLRVCRNCFMVDIAVSDLVANVPLTLSLQRLSGVADALILSALEWLSNFCQERWGMPVNAKGKEQPLLVYGMGKLGGKELNFSSDIDLIFVYPESGETVGQRKSLDNHAYFTRLGQKLIAALNQQTADGFVYRVDMRLRPFGESGPLVLSFSAMEDYYQEQGRDWERYAMLKARLIGEGHYHEKLTKMLRPFVYRRYIDFSVIESLRKMKMMISQEVRRKQLVNNIKLGAGGIREVEFIVQVFQLIRGGRVAQLQQRSLLTVLPLLVEHEVIPQTAATTLTNAYLFLRRVENIIQALDDKQTQTLPDCAIDQTRIIHVLGFENWSLFLTELNQHLANVHREFNLLIGEEAPNHQDISLSWENLWFDLQDISDGLDWQKQVASNWQEDQAWHDLIAFKDDCDNRPIGQRGRQVLDKLMPRILWRIHQVEQGQLVLPRVLKVIAKIVSRTAYLELLFENEGALIQLIRLCEQSAWICDYIAKFPILLDELIDPKLLNNPPELGQYAKDLQVAMLRIPEDDVESQMDALRQFKQAQQLRIAAADVCGVLPIMKVSDHLTALAEAIIAEVVQQAWQQLTKRFGQPKSTLGQHHKGFAVIGYGKMGGIELGYGSDLDLVFLHESDANDITNGEKEISAMQFYAKLAQKIMHIFNTRMSSGILYELDMRLRPSGNSGVLVIHVDSFKDYQQQEAWTWEHQALVRSRFVYGHQAIKQRFDDIRQQILSMERNPQQLKSDVIEMRNKMRSHLDKSTDEFSDIKHAQGGLVDIEFLAQFLVLANSAKQPTLTEYSDNVRIFEQLTQVQLLTPEQSSALINCYCALRNMGHRAVLNNSDAKLSAVEFKSLASPVWGIWQQFMGN